MELYTCPICGKDSPNKECNQCYKESDLHYYSQRELIEIIMKLQDDLKKADEFIKEIY